MSIPMKSNLDFENASKIINLPNPASAQDAATKAYVDSAIEGVAWKDSVRVSTQGNINLSSPGASIDSISLSSGDRVLVRSQTSQPENGIYIWNGAASAMTRAADASTAAELEQAITTVEEGTDAGASFRQTQVNFTLDTGNVIWTSFGTGAPSASETTAGIAEIATQAETDTGTDDTHFVTPLKAKTASWRVKKFTATIGDSSATQFDVTHNFNSDDVVVEVYDASTKATVLCDVKRQTANAVRLNFTSAPATNGMKVVILA